MDWSLPDEVDLQENDFATLQLPSVFEGYAGIFSGNLDENEEDGTFIRTIGNFSVDDNNLMTVVFNNQLVGEIGRSGEIWLRLQLTADIFEDDAEQKIDFVDPVNKSYTIVKKFADDDLKIFKSGQVFPAMNPTRINWTIDINTNLRQLTADSFVEDIIPDGLKLDESSIEVYELIVGADGKIKGERGTNLLGEGTIKLSDETIENYLKIEIGETYKAYRILYSTFITGAEQNEYKDSYKNTATLQDGEDKESADFEVTGFSVGSIIEKSGKKDNKSLNSKTITWTIDVNQAQQVLDEVVIKDYNMREVPVDGEASGAEITLQADSIKIYYIDHDGNEWNQSVADSADYVLTTAGLEAGELFRLEFVKLDEQAVRIVFDSNIEYVGEYKNSNTFENNVELTYQADGEDITKGVHSEIAVNRGTLLKKTGKEITKYDDSPVILWTVTVNSAEHTIDGATLVDTIPEGLELIDGSVEINPGKNLDDQEITSDYVDGSRELTIDFGRINTKYVVQYKTNKTDDEINFTAISNNARLTGDSGGIEAEDDATPIEDVFNQYAKATVSGLTIERDDENEIAYDGINYSAKTMSWHITVDALKDKITSLTITDSFVPAGSMVFLKDTLVVRKTPKVGAPSLLVEDDHYQLVDSVYLTEGFELDFIIDPGNNLDLAKYEIFFKTSFDPDEIIAEGGSLHTDEDYAYKYINKAEFTYTTVNNSEEVSVERSAEYDKIIDYIFNGGKKDATLDRANRTISWEVFVNSLGRDFNDTYTITDTLSGGQKYIKETLKIYPYYINVSGEISYDEDDVLSETAYDLSVSEDGKVITIVFEGGIDQPYLVKFASRIEGISEEKYKNRAVVTFGDEEYKYEAEAKYKDSDLFISKKANTGTDEKNKWAFKDDVIEWEIKVNESLSYISSGAEVEDTLSPGLFLLEDSIEVYDGANKLLVQDDYDLSNSEDLAGNTVLKITFNKAIEEKIYTIKYKTVVVGPRGSTIENEASFSGEGGDITGSDSKSYTAQHFAGGTGTGTRNFGISLDKLDADDGEHLLQGAGFQLYYYLLGETKYYVENSTAEPGDDDYTRRTHFTNESGTLIFESLVKREYFLVEVTPPAGFTLDPAAEHIHIDPEGLDAGASVYRLELTNEREKTQITVRKEWQNGPAARPAVTLQLTRDGESLGEDYQVTLPYEGDWQYSWSELDKYDVYTNKEFVYGIEEKVVPENYSLLSIAEEDKGVIVVTNEYVIPTTELTVRKEWLNGPAARPEVTLQLTRDGESLGDDYQVTLPYEGDWNFTWYELDATDIAGRPYQYAVIEEEEPENYELISIAEDDNGVIVVTNGYVIPTTELTVRKEWLNGPAARPEVTLQLTRDGESLGDDYQVTLPYEGDWNFTWDKLDATDIDGRPYEYGVAEEDEPLNYELISIEEVDGLIVVTNKYVIPATDITVRKEWVNGPSDRPQIELELLRNGESIAGLEVAVLTQAQPSHTWENLDLTDINGEAYTYTVVETNVPDDYKESYSADENGLVVTNTYVSPKTEVTGKKIWDGGPAVKPEIELQLYQNGQAYGDPVKLANGKEEYIWKDLDKTDSSGKAYLYTVDEINVPENYTKKAGTDGLTITNSYVSPLTELTVSKKWVGGLDNPPLVEVQLYRDGEPYGDPVELVSKDRVGSYTWENLAVTDQDGKVYQYTVDELTELGSYKKTIEGFVITNTYEEPEKPVLEKDVNGKTDLDVTDLDQLLVYDISTRLPADTSDYYKLIISDDLVDVLEVVEARALVNGVHDKAISAFIKQDGQSVRLVLEYDSFDFKTLAGKTLTLEIDAKIKADADLTPYIDEAIPNQAVLQLNDSPAVKNSNMVTINPPDIPLDVPKTGESGFKWQYPALMLVLLGGLVVTRIFYKKRAR